MEGRSNSRAQTKSFGKHWPVRAQWDVGGGQGGPPLPPERLYLIALAV